MPYLDGARVLGQEWEVGDRIRHRLMSYYGTVVATDADHLTVRLDDPFLGSHVHDFAPEFLLYAGKAI